MRLRAWQAERLFSDVQNIHIRPFVDTARIAVQIISPPPRSIMRPADFEYHRSMLIEQTSQLIQAMLQNFTGERAERRELESYAADTFASRMDLRKCL